MNFGARRDAVDVEDDLLKRATTRTSESKAISSIDTGSLIVVVLIKLHSIQVLLELHRIQVPWVYNQVLAVALPMSSRLLPAEALLG